MKTAYSFIIFQITGTGGSLIVIVFFWKLEPEIINRNKYLPNTGKNLNATGTSLSIIVQQIYIHLRWRW